MNLEASDYVCSYKEVNCRPFTIKRLITSTNMLTHTYFIKVFHHDKMGMPGSLRILVAKYRGAQQDNFSCVH